MATTVTLIVNGKQRSVRVDDPEMPLLYALRNDLDLHGAALRLRARAVRRLHGARRRPGGALLFVPGRQGRGHARSSRWKGSARRRSRIRCRRRSSRSRRSQCGYCINGMIMQAAAFLQTQQAAERGRRSRQALANNLCRCGTHARIVRAVKRASESMA